ncbi:MAG: hypothetical protein LBN30_10670 [Oscillospiraceae bacterium]|nr:hypothetical protein [Oscillospiraceae bacterium]
MLFARIEPRGDVKGGKAARETLRAAMLEVYGLELPEIAKTAAGKPYFPARPEIYFSISHTKTHVMVALSDKPVGCDIETVREVRGGVAERVFTAEQLRRRGFFELWTEKEATFKLFSDVNVDGSFCVNTRWFFGDFYVAALAFFVV